MKKEVSVIKIGGHVIDDHELLISFLRAFSAVQGYKVLVHGGGKVANDMSARLGIEPKMIDGRRITDDASLEVVTMTYAGLINKKIVSYLQSIGCNAAGFCGADGNLLPAIKRDDPGINYGWVGDISSVNIKLIDILAISGFVPVIAPLTHDGHGNILNTNADTIASALAIALSSNYAVSLVFCFEKNGLLRNVSDPESVISKISSRDIASLIDSGSISGGMLPKVQNIFSGLQNGVEKVLLCAATDLQRAVQDPGSKGTTFML